MKEENLVVFRGRERERKEAFTEKKEHNLDFLWVWE